MRVTLDRTLFDVQSPPEAVALVDLLSTAVRDLHGHAMLTDPPYLPGQDNGPIDVWLNGRNWHEAQAFRTLLTNGLLTAAGPRSAGVSDSSWPRRWHLAGPLEIRVERRGQSDWRNRVLTLADAVDLLSEPVHLVMENAWTELAFVRHLAGPTNGTTLQALLDRPGRVATHGGGSGEAKKWVEALTENPPTSRTWRRMLRTWVLFDNDAGDLDVRQLSRHAIALIHACESVVAIHGAGLSWVCLRRRELESYMPDSALHAEAPMDRVPFVQKVISWRSDPSWAPLAWALDLKKGLHGDLVESLSQADRTELKNKKIPLQAHMLKPPFAGLSPGDVSILARGLGEKLGEALRATPDRAWTYQFPAEYDRGPADQAPRFLFVQSLFDRM
ncbi:hypothetical protein [Polyangium sp. 15x6]|uniref:hypothetical protein n=1 Tax=Polyangium sp. 15x6 TaxID=3042687 RepID=UPI00249B1056|nr:hypothetical protein [Polyangium sp. 15x6]MDI3289587.1 hypothetical protein [Polyangium sp. 15x6]